MNQNDELSDKIINYYSKSLIPAVAANETNVFE
jgi:hypothetical protein